MWVSRLIRNDSIVSNHIVFRKSLDIFDELYQFASEILELSIHMGQVQTCSTNFLSDKNW
jgi:hypothetical protein